MSKHVGLELLNAVFLNLLTPVLLPGVVLLMKFVLLLISLLPALRLLLPRLCAPLFLMWSPPLPQAVLVWRSSSGATRTR